MSTASSSVAQAGSNGIQTAGSSFLDAAEASAVSFIERLGDGSAICIACHRGSLGGVLTHRASCAPGRLLELVGKQRQPAAVDLAHATEPSAPSPAGETARLADWRPEDDMDDPASMEGSYRSDFKVPTAIRPDIAVINRAADDAGMPIPRCPKCGLPLNADHTHRTYEEHDACRNKGAVPEPVSPEGGNVIHVPRIPGTVNTPVGPMIPAPEAAAEDVPKSYNDFLRKYYPATAEKLIAESADREQPAAEIGIWPGVETAKEYDQRERSEYAAEIARQVGAPAAVSDAEKVTQLRLDNAVLSMAFHEVLADFHGDDTTFQAMKQSYIQKAMAEIGLLESLLPHFLDIAGMSEVVSSQAASAEGDGMHAADREQLRLNRAFLEGGGDGVVTTINEARREFMRAVPNDPSEDRVEQFASLALVPEPVESDESWEASEALLRQARRVVCGRAIVVFGARIGHDVLVCGLGSLHGDGWHEDEEAGVKWPVDAASITRLACGRLKVRRFGGEPIYIEQSGPARPTKAEAAK